MYQVGSFIAGGLVTASGVSTSSESLTPPLPKHLCTFLLYTRVSIAAWVRGGNYRTLKSSNSVSNIVTSVLASNKSKNEASAPAFACIAPSNSTHPLNPESSSLLDPDDRLRLSIAAESSSIKTTEVTNVRASRPMSILSEEIIQKSPDSEG